MHTVYIGLGSNIGDRKKNCLWALDQLESAKNCSIKAVSDLYSTEPVDYLDQDWFINMAAHILTKLSPDDFLFMLKSLEKQAGRTSDTPRFGPRILDLDILFYDELVLNTPDLVLPHPRLHKRRFVLTPLCDIAGNLKHPVLKKTVGKLLKNLDDNAKKVISCG